MNTYLAASIKKVEDGLYELRVMASALAKENQELKDKHSNRKKLTGRDVERIRALAARGDYKQREIADMFDLAAPTVSRIIRGIYHKG